MANRLVCDTMKKPLVLAAVPVREREREKLREHCIKLKKAGATPLLKVVLVGDNSASVLYTGRKKDFIKSLGGQCEIIQLESTISPEKFIGKVREIVENKDVHGCLVQLPLPPQLSGIPVGELIPKEKDVDGFNSKNLNLLLRGDKGEKALLPCTPKGIMTLLEYYDLSVEGRKVAVLGRSMIVGKPMAMLISNYNGTPTLCHSKTVDIRQICCDSDVIISAVGVPCFLDSSYIGENRPIVIDVGINRNKDGSLCGDVDYDNVAPLCSAITPVPGGVGPMTVVSLARNLFQAVDMQEVL